MNSNGKMYRKDIIYLLCLLMFCSSTNSSEIILLYCLYWDAAILKELELSQVFYLVLNLPLPLSLFFRELSSEFAGL